MTLPINKIYIDSRHKAVKNSSNSNFEIQLKESLNLPDNCICVVSDVVMKNTITTIEPFNDRMYVRCNEVDKVVFLDSRNYDVQQLTIQIVMKMNIIFEQAFNTAETIFLGVEDIYNNKVIIACMTGYRFRIFTDEELHFNSMQWNGEYYDRTNMKSCNNILAHFENSQEHQKIIHIYISKC